MVLKFVIIKFTEVYTVFLYINSRVFLISGDFYASERALKALHFAFRGVGIALAGATRFVFNIYKRFMII